MSRNYKISYLHVYGIVREYDFGEGINLSISNRSHKDPKTYDPERLWWGAVNNENLMRYLRNCVTLKQKLRWANIKAFDNGEYFEIKEANLNDLFIVLEEALARSLG